MHVFGPVLSVHNFGGGGGGDLVIEHCNPKALPSSRNMQSGFLSLWLAEQICASLGFIFSPDISPRYFHQNSFLCSPSLIFKAEARSS